MNDLQSTHPRKVNCRIKRPHFHVISCRVVDSRVLRAPTCTPILHHSRLRHRRTDVTDRPTASCHCVQQYVRLVNTLLEVQECSVMLEINFCITGVQIAVGKLTLSPSKPFS